MISSTVCRLSLFSICAIFIIYVIFMVGHPIGIELPDYLLLKKETKLPKKMLRYVKGQVEERQYWLKKVLAFPESPEGYQRLYDNLVPEVFCPHLMRVGSTNEGGQWICNPWRIPDKCSIFSVGLDRGTSFEQDLQKMTDHRCKIFAFGDTTDEVEEEEFKAINGEVEEINKSSIGELIAKHGVEKVELLKIGIEPSRFPVLLEYLEDHVVSQLLVTAEGSAGEVLKLAANLSDLGYWLVHHQIDGKDHSISHFSLIHETAFRTYGVKLLARYLDISNRT